MKGSFMITNIKYMVMQGLYWASFASLYGFATVYLLSRGFLDGTVGMTLAAANVIAAVSQSFLASFADRAGKPILKEIILTLVGLFLAVAAALLLVSGKLPTLLLYGMAIVLVQVLQAMISAFAMELSANGASINFGATRGMGSLSYSLSSSFCGFMSAKYGMSAPVVITFILASFLLITSVCIKVPHVKQPLLHKEKQAEACSSVEFFLKYRRFTMVLLGAVLLFTCYNLMCIYMIRIMESVGGGSREMGFTFSLAAALELPTMLLFSVIVRRLKCGTLLKAASVFLTCKAIGIAVAGSVSGVYLAQLFQPLSYAIFIPASVYYTDKVICAKDRVKGQSMMVTTTIMGGVTGSLLGGFLLEFIDISHLLMVACGISALGTAFILLNIQKDGEAPRQ